MNEEEQYISLEGIDNEVVEGDGFEKDPLASSDGNEEIVEETPHELENV